MRQRRKIRIQRQVPKLSEGLESKISEYEIEDEEDVNMEDPLADGVRHDYRNETRSQQSFTYDPKPRDFIGRRGTTQLFHQLPTMLQLFELFWPFTALCKFFEETDCYATTVVALETI